MTTPKQYTLFADYDKAIKVYNFRSGGDVFVSFPYNAEALSRVKQLKGRRWHPELKSWSCERYEKQKLLKILDGIFQTSFLGMYRDQVTRGDGPFMENKIAEIDDDMPKLYAEATNRLNDAKKSSTIEYVYFISAAIGDHRNDIKIGYSNNPFKRFNTFKTGNSCIRSILFVVKGGQDVEISLHRLFDKFHAQGEWFTECEEMIIYLEKIKAGWECDCPTSEQAELVKKTEKEEAKRKTEYNDEFYKAYDDLATHSLATQLELLPQLLNMFPERGYLIKAKYKYTLDQLRLESTQTTEQNKYQNETKTTLENNEE